MIKKIGKLPVNSRIFIDYQGAKPKITFKYPKRNAKEQVNSSSATVLPAMFLAGIVLIIIYSYFHYIHDGEPIIQGGTYTNDSIIVNYTFRGENHVDTIDSSNSGVFIKPRVSWAGDPSIKSMLLAEIGDLLIMFALFFIFTGLFTKLLGLIFRRTSWGNKKFPEFNKMITNEDFSAIFKEAPNGIVELPLFKNMYLDYRAVGEFSKHLKTFEIVEHPFNRIIKKRGKGWRYWKKTRKKKDRNIFLWKAIFTFAQPIQKTEGSFLEIRWT